MFHKNGMAKWGLEDLIPRWRIRASLVVDI